MDENNKCVTNKEKQILVTFSSTNEMEPKSAMRLIIESHDEEQSELYPEAL